MRTLLLLIRFLAIIISIDSAKAWEFESDRAPLETPDDTADEIRECLFKSGAYDMSAAAYEAQSKSCTSNTNGLNLFELDAMVQNCFERDVKTKAACVSVEMKLGKHFHHGAAQITAEEITATEYIVIEFGCYSMKDGIYKVLCQSGEKKIRNLMIKLHPKLSN